jgi:hypothetical protein
MPAFRSLRLLFLGTALTATSSLHAAKEELIQVVNQSTAKYSIILQGNEGNTGEFTVSLDGKSTRLVPWGAAEGVVPAQKVANIFVERNADGKLLHTFFIRDEGYKQVKVQVSAGRTTDPVTVTLPTGTKLVVSGTQIVITSTRN